jgi:hypothetical protein
MNQQEHPNAKLFIKKDQNEAKKFDRRNNQNSKARAKRIEEEAFLSENFLNNMQVLSQELLLANKKIEKQKLIILGLLKDKQRMMKEKK